MSEKNISNPYTEETHVEVTVLRKVLQAYSDNVHKSNDSLAKKRLGKILTIVDSAISDETQRKAIKDMVNDAWYSSEDMFRYEPYPQARHVAEALGFELWPTSENYGSPLVEPFNPYKEIVK